MKYYQGDGVEQSFEQAATYLQLAEDKGDMRATYFLNKHPELRRNPEAVIVD